MKITNSSTLYKNRFTKHNSKTALHPGEFWDKLGLGCGILGFLLLKLNLKHLVEKQC
jgi:hypothetical protein